MLILMPTHASHPQAVQIVIPYRQSIKVLDPESFANFMGYEEEHREEFMNCIKLIKEATDISLKVKKY